jgi:hypothetical protein
MASTRKNDKDQPLIDDIRLLGRILGDVIREQEGAAAFDLIEQVRQLSVAFRRDADHEADRALKKLLKGLSADQTVSVIRAFTYFSHLANLAEDRHHIRRRTIRERAGDTQEGSIDVALARLRWAGIAPSTVAQTLAGSYVSPVLTAHPTEVQRKSILDAERAIAKLLAERGDIWPSAPSSTTAPATPSRRANWPQRGAAARPRHAAVANAAAALLQADGGRRDRERAERTTKPPFCAKFPKSTPNLNNPWARAAWPAFCAWASGLAATATAIPTWAPTPWCRRCAGKARWRCATT